MLPEPTVFVVDDDAAGRRALLGLLKSMRLRAEGFASAREFRQAYRPAQPGCLLVDVGSPDGGGMGLLADSSAAETHPPVIAVAAGGDVATAVRAMRAGAINFLEKPCGAEELRAAVREALRCDARNLRRFARRETIRRRLARLTPGERQVLHSLLDGKPNKTIAAELGTSVRTIEVRRAKLMRKMHAESLAELIRTALAARHCPDVLSPRRAKGREA